MKRTHCQGLSLIEVLISVAIVGVLATLMVGGMNIWKKKAATSGALSNLRSLAASAANYGSDHTGDLPPYRSSEYTGNAVFWGSYLPAMYGSSAARTMKTPGDDMKQANNPALLRGPETDISNGQRNIYWSYARNLELPKNKTSTFNDGTVSALRMPQPSRTMLFIETRQNGAMYSSYPESNFNFDDPSPKGRTASAFLDGHVELVSRQAILGTPDTPEDRETFRLFWFGYPDATARRDY